MKKIFIIVGLFFIFLFLLIAAARAQSPLVALVNQDRARNGVYALIESSQLDTSSQAKANDMCTKNYFAHVSPTGKTWLDWMHLAGYYPIWWGENIAHGYGDLGGAEGAFMNSLEHRVNILSYHFKEIGVGECGSYIVEQFGSR